LITNELINLIQLQLQEELNRQTAFIEILKNHNLQLDSQGLRILYSIDQLIKTMESNLSAIKKAIKQLPLEENLAD